MWARPKRGFPGGSDSKESACTAGDLGSIPRLGRFPGERHGNPLQYSCLENPHGQRSWSGYSSWSHRVGHDWATKLNKHLFALCPLSGEFLSEVKVEFFSKAFSSHIEIMIWFLLFNLLIRGITLIDLWLLKNSCSLGANPTWPYYKTLLTYCIQVASILLNMFVSMSISDMGM